MLKVLTSAIKQENEIKDEIWNKKTKQTLIEDSMITFIENSSKFYKWLDLMSGINKVEG